eukprot:jgi/Mesen1/9342/ME000061S08781
MEKISSEGEQAVLDMESVPELSKSPGVTVSTPPLVEERVSLASQELYDASILETRSSLDNVATVAEAPKSVEEAIDSEEDDQELDNEDEEDDLLEALDWVDLQEDLASRGSSHAGSGSSFGSGYSVHRRPNAFGGAYNVPANAAGNALQPRSNKQQRLSGHINPGPLQDLDRPRGMGMSNAVETAVRESGRKVAQGSIRLKEKADRATVEQVLDPRTRMVLFKLLNRGVFSDIHGCLSTGKEANVYHATAEKGEHKELAIKVYKTSILVFKDRERYVQGDFRFRHGYSKHNPRKMVKTWAEKEFRNLSRLRAAGINCPVPVLLRLHILDAALSELKLRECYFELVVAMRQMYQKCRLVHGDLSEYNILYHEGRLWIIDVSQSVDLDHPRALDFLREDCLHVTDYFKKNGVPTMHMRELFDFVTDPTLTDDTTDDYLEKMQERVENRAATQTAEEEVAEAVFAQSYIPRALDQVKDYERDMDRIASGKDTEGIYYQTITGLREDLSGVRQVPALLEDGTPVAAREAAHGASDDAHARPPAGSFEFAPVARSSQGSIPAAASGRADETGSGKEGEGEAADESPGTSDSEDDEGEESEGGGEEHRKGSSLSRDDERAARKEHKKKVKEERRESRKTKVPKAIKRKKKKLASGKGSRG